ncbi:MAG: GNAT family N-acetyltransferase [Thermoplasmata archaeon]|nr:GNAT family N-acetyltransferase [Thermoplasmata archaeon]
MAAPGERTIKDFRLRPLNKPEEFRAVEEVQRLAWGLTDEPPVAAPIQRAMQDQGGLVIGAFADIHLAGFSLGFIGWDGTSLYHYSHLTAVRPEYQNHRLGFRLKTYQRDEVLQQGLATIRWTFDPLQSRNAFLYLRRLGAAIDGYLVHYYGQLASELDRGSETDRVRVTWTLADPRTEKRVAGTYPTPTEDETRLEAAAAIVETDVGEHGLRIPVAVTEPTAPTAHLEIPFDVGLLRIHEPASLRTWRHAARDAFRAALDSGYVIDDFAVVRRDRERRSFYFLTRRPSASPTPPPPA